jgi:hypothetical protein
MEKVGLVLFIVLSLSVAPIVGYLVDRHAHEGVDWFKRRRVLTSGQRASATVLSSSILVGSIVGNKLRSAYSIVYEVRPNDGPAFRARGIEVLYHSEGWELKEGAPVDVRFDPVDKTVVLVRRDRAQVQRERDAERRSKEEALLRSK